MAVARNKSKPITCFVGLPHAKKTFLSLYLSTTEPVIHADFSHKDLKAKSEVYKKYNMAVYEVTSDKLSVKGIQGVLKSMKRGTLVLDDFSVLPNQDQLVLADSVLQFAGSDVKVHLVAHAYRVSSFYKRGLHLSITLPTILLPLDERLVDFVFIQREGLTMLGKTEVRWVF